MGAVDPPELFCAAGCDDAAVLQNYGVGPAKLQRFSKRLLAHIALYALAEPQIPRKIRLQGLLAKRRGRNNSGNLFTHRHSQQTLHRVRTTERPREQLPLPFAQRLERPVDRRLSRIRQGNSRPLQAGNQVWAAQSPQCLQ